MGISQFPPISIGASVSVEPIGSTGTYTLAVPLTPGLYKITTDTSQSLNTSQLYFQTAEGFRFGAVVRGGQGYVSVPQTITTITFTSGTFPLLIGFEKFDSYSLIAAPNTNNSSVTYYPALTTPKLDLSFTAPSGATSMGIYWPNGTFTDLNTTTSPKTSITMPTTPSVAEEYKFLVVAKDSKGVWGLGTLIDRPYPYQVFTSSGTFNPISGSSVANVLIVAGGGAGGGQPGGQYWNGGGGGAGRARYETNVSINSSVSVTVGAGGSGVGGTGNPGGQSAFGAITATGGSGGIANGAGGNSGAGFTGGTGPGGGGAGNTQNGYPVSGGVGGNGGNGSTYFGTQFSGGGGGFPSGQGAFGGGNAGGWDQNGLPATSRGSGGGGARSNGGGVAGGAGGAGVVIVEPIFS